MNKTELVEKKEEKYGWMIRNYYQIELTEKCKPYVIETNKYSETNSNKIKLFTYKLDKVGSIQEIPSMNIAEVSVTYKKDAKSRVCDIDMMFVINRLKLDHINFKNNNYNQLDSKKVWTVTKETECNLGKWIIQQEQENKNYTKTANWKNLKDAHERVHKGVQSVIHDNANGNLNGMLDTTMQIDLAIYEVFKTMQTTKEENCGN